MTTPTPVAEKATLKKLIKFLATRAELAKWGCNELDEARWRSLPWFAKERQKLFDKHCSTQFCLHLDYEGDLFFTYHTDSGKRLCSKLNKRLEKLLKKINLKKLLGNFVELAGQPIIRKKYNYDGSIKV